MKKVFIVYFLLVLNNSLHALNYISGGGNGQKFISGEIKSPVTNGMTIELGNYVQQVKVRAKSFGPGACGVEFFISGETSGFLAPTLFWSPWTKIEPAFLGESKQEVGFSEICDTGAIAEIRYFK